MRPVYVRTLEDLRSAVTLNSTTESLFVEFKVDLDRTKDDWQVEVAQDITQFANTLGGCLLIGIAESKDRETRVKVAAAFAGVQDPDRTREWVEQAITQKAVPSTLTHDVAMVTVDGRTIVAVNVPPSRGLVYVWHRTRDDETIRCVYRTNHGKARMNPDEMERRMVSGSRASKLAFADARATCTGDKVVVHGGIWGYPQNGLVLLMPTFSGIVTAVHEEWAQIRGRVSAGIYGLGDGECTVNIPFDVLRSVWVDPNETLALLLSVRLVLVTGLQIAFESL